jgi:nicotinate-nucleotide adenylyltransferase
MRVGLYGGSFDPPHLGHWMVAHAAREEAGLDRLLVIPAAQSPFKPGRQPAPAAHRCAMLRLTFAGDPWVELDESELSRGGISYTVDTVRACRKRLPADDLFYLIGADNVESLPAWREASALAELVQFLIIPRPGEAPSPLPTGFSGQLLNGHGVDVSSSEVRSRIASGRPFDHLLRPGVPDLIRNNRLYL